MAVEGVTVVVATLNRGGFLLDCLRDLLAQNHRPLEILVVDQSDRTAAEIAQIAEKNSNVIDYHHVSFRGLPKARNYGWQKARYEAIIFVDDDTRFGADLVTEHLRALKRPGVGVVAGGIDEANGPVDSGPPVDVFRTWTATPFSGFAARGELIVDHARGANFSVWKKALKKVGGFDQTLNVGAALYEELDMCLRVKKIGFEVFFNGRARVTHLAVATDGCRVDKVADYVRGLAHNRSIVIRRNVRWFQIPIALVRLMILGFSYARHYRAPGALGACIQGCFSVFRNPTLSPICTYFEPKNRP